MTAYCLHRCTCDNVVPPQVSLMTTYCLHRCCLSVYFGYRSLYQYKQYGEMPNITCSYSTSLSLCIHRVLCYHILVRTSRKAVGPIIYPLSLTVRLTHSQTTPCLYSLVLHSVLLEINRYRLECVTRHLLEKQPINSFHPTEAVWRGGGLFNSLGTLFNSNCTVYNEPSFFIYLRA